jgi:hypothetical protein
VTSFVLAVAFCFCNMGWLVTKDIVRFFKFYISITSLTP